MKIFTRNNKNYPQLKEKNPTPITCMKKMESLGNNTEIVRNVNMALETQPTKNTKSCRVN